MDDRRQTPETQETAETRDTPTPPTSGSLLEPSSKLRILLVDDHGFVREGLKALIRVQPDMEVVGEAEDGEAALKKTDDCIPDIVVMDISMPRMNGTEATKQMKAACPAIKVLALSMHEDATYLRGLLEAGANGYVLKRSAPQELIQALRSVAAGGTYLDPAVAAKVTNAFTRKAALRGETLGQDLSEREEDVLRRTAQGYSSKEIAAQLGVSMKTVESYKARAQEKLGIASRADIVRYAAQKGWLQDL